MRAGRGRTVMWALAIASSIAAVSACGDDAAQPVATGTVTPTDSATSTTTTTTTTTSTTTTTTTSSSPPASTTSSTSAPTTAAPTTTAPLTTLPGEPFEPIYATAGAELGAVAVAFDATLDVRAAPGADQPVIASLPPLAAGIVSTGRAQTLGVRDGWLEVSTQGATGWVPLLNLLYIGGTRDTTAEYLVRLGATTAPTMLELGRLVAESVASTDPVSRVVPVVAPTAGATAEVTYDVVDFPDDAGGGVRLRIAARRVDSGGASVYELTAVESTALCYRGATPDGFCV